MVEESLARIEAGNRAMNAFILVMADQAQQDAREADRSWSRAAIWGRCTVYRCRSRTSWMSAGRRRRQPRVFARSHGRSRRAYHRASAARRRRLGRKDQPSRVCLRHDQRGSGSARREIPSIPALSGRLERRIGDQHRRRNGARHVGTDTGGSIRIPAAAVASSGSSRLSAKSPPKALVPLSRTLDHVGPLALYSGRRVDGVSRADGASPHGRGSRRPRRPRFGSPCRVRTSATCWTTTWRSRFEEALDRSRARRYGGSRD